MTNLIPTSLCPCNYCNTKNLIFIHHRLLKQNLLDRLGSWGDLWLYKSTNCVKTINSNEILILTEVVEQVFLLMLL
jgi:hypothetical protein